MKKTNTLNTKGTFGCKTKVIELVRQIDSDYNLKLISKFKKYLIDTRKST